MEEQKRYSIVLAGGGGKGAYQIGALKALKEMGLLKNLKSVAGTSIGAVNSAFLASDTLDKAENQWRNIDPGDFIELDDNGFDLGKDGDGIFTREGLRRIIENNADLRDMSCSDTDYYITVCTRLPDGMAFPVYKKMNGKDPDTIMTYIMASSAIPIVYDNVCAEGVMYFDGGIRDNTPIRPLYDDGATDIIVISNDSNYRELPIWDRAKLYPIVPSRSLDMDTLTGTADLSRENAAYRLRLGYLDAKATMQALLSGRRVPDLSGNHALAMQERKMAAVTSSLNENMAGLARLLGGTDFLN